MGFNGRDTIALALFGDINGGFFCPCEEAPIGSQFRLIL